MPGQKQSRYAIQAVENALDVLEVLSDSPEEFCIAQLTSRLTLSKMTIFRLLSTFEQRGYVEKERAGQYRIGVTALEIGAKLLLRLSLLQKAKPVMENLAWKCNEAIYLGVRKGTEVLLLEMVDSLDQVKVVPLIGRRFPMEKVAAGIVLLGEKQTDDDPHRPADHLGFAADCGALGAGVVSLAVPLRNGSGRICGSLCLIGPEYRLGDERIARELRPTLLEAGEVISSRLGYFGPPANREGGGESSLRGTANNLAPASRDCTATIL